jgi:hypothetical protein
MNLTKVLGKVDPTEKLFFLKILNKYGQLRRDTNPKIDKILSDSDNPLEKIDDSQIVELFYLLREQYSDHIDYRIRYSKYQLDLAVEVFTRDDNQIISHERFQTLYKESVDKLKKQTRELQAQLKSDKSKLPAQKKRDYLIFRDCVKTAYENDLLINRYERITFEENTILETLARSLGLSNEEIRVVTFTIIQPLEHNIDDITNELKEIGVLFFHRSTNTIFVPDEIVYELQKLLKVESTSSH